MERQKQSGREGGKKEEWVKENRRYGEGREGEHNRMGEKRSRQIEVKERTMRKVKRWRQSYRVFCFVVEQH